jgi:nicotinamidase-related amidase
MYKGRTTGQVLPCVLLDLNTQRDFFDSGGACPVLGTSDLYRRLRRAVAWVKRNNVPVLSTMDIHRAREAGSAGLPAHCVEGTPGQSKLDFTLLRNRVYVAGDNTLAVSVDLFKRHQQVIFPQRSSDLFANPKADRFITQLKVAEFITVGAVAEREVKAVVLGLLARGKNVTIVSDLCGAWNSSEMDLSIRQMEAKGATIITVDELTTRKLPRRHRYTASSLVSVQRPIAYADPSIALRSNGARDTQSNGRTGAAPR